MRTNSDIFVKSKVKGRRFLPFIVAHADEAPVASTTTVVSASGTSDTPPMASPQMNFEEMIARVRKEEKDKLYGEISRLREESKALRESNNNYILQLAEYQKRYEEATKKSDSEEVERLNGEITRLTKELDEAKASAPDEAAIREQIKAEYEVKMYAQQQIAENKDKILTAFADGVGGATKEEVDASIQTAIEKSLSIKKELGLVDDEGNPKSGNKDKWQKHNKSDNPAPPVTNPASPDATTLDIDYISKLDVRSPEYAEFRKKMGLK